MEGYTKIDMASWHRADLYRLYTEYWTTCSFDIQQEIDVTETVRYMRERGKMFAPALYYAATSALNTRENFRLSVVDGELVMWDKISPMFPVLTKYEDICFHTVEFTDDFKAFYSAYEEDKQKNADCCRGMTQRMPPNVYSISIIRSVPFTTFAFDMKNPKDYLLPMVFISQYTEKNGRLMLQVSIHVNHAATDAYHTSIFFAEMQKILAEPGKYLALD